MCNSIHVYVVYRKSYVYTLIQMPICYDDENQTPLHNHALTLPTVDSQTQSLSSFSVLCK